MALSDEQIELRLKGKSWAVYWFALGKGGPVTVREVQRSLGFSSPSIAQHHLETLRDLGLLDREEGSTTYTVIRRATVGPLRDFVFVVGRPIPRFLFYACFLSAMYLAYLAFFFSSLTREAALFLAFGAFAVAFSWYEVYRAIKSMPF
jgi:DNA-binding transcriptional ArsR family regulator